MIRVNLLPKVGRRTRTRDWQSVAGGAVALLVFGGMLFMWWNVKSQAGTLQGRIVTMQAEVKKLEFVAKKVDKFKADKKVLEERIKVIKTLLAAQKVPVHLLQALNDQLPEEVWLHGITKTGGRLVIRGYSFTDFGIANFLTRLGQNAPLLRNVELVVSEQTEVQKVPLKKFEIICTVPG